MMIFALGASLRVCAVQFQFCNIGNAALLQIATQGKSIGEKASHQSSSTSM